MKFEFSAGGIVYKYQKSKIKSQKDEILILVCQHSQHHGWVFPKGLIGDKEDNRYQTKEETAVREVKEETGIDGEIEAEIKPTSYFYVWDNEKIKKTVYYFIMKFKGGDTNDHDDEMEDVMWIDYNQVSEKLTYASEKEAWEEAKELIANG